MEKGGERNTKNKTKTLQLSSSVSVTEYASANVSLAGAAASIIFIAKHVFCHDKSMLAATRVLSRQNIFVATKLLSQKNICRDKRVFVAGKVLA